MIEENEGRIPEPTLEDFKYEWHLRSKRSMHSVRLRQIPTDMIRTIVEEAGKMKNPVLKIIYTEDSQAKQKVPSGYTVEEKVRDRA